MTAPAAPPLPATPPGLAPRRAFERRWDRFVASRYGGPARVLLRGTGAGLLALVAAAVQAHDNPGVLCPLRRFTGVPCPGCGSTSVFMDLGAGHVGAAIAANPVTVLVGLGLLFAPSEHHHRRRGEHLLGLAIASVRVHSLLTVRPLR
jgi:hypothetical protein